MRIILTTTILLFALMGFGQRKIEATNSFKVFGKVKTEKMFNLKTLDSFPKQVIKDQILYNHKGEIKDVVTNIKGVAIKTVLEKIDFIYEKPKELNEFYFVMMASDGYKVVFSWNEIYNTEVGNQLFFITEMGGKKIEEMPEHIILSSAADIKNGRRYIKGLQNIEVKKNRINLI